MASDTTQDANEGLQSRKPSETSERMMTDVMTMLMERATNPAKEQVTNLGQIARMEMPSGWQPGPNYDTRQHSATYREFHPQGDPGCQLGFYYRGRRTSEYAGDKFHETLQKPSHILGDAELATLKEVIRDKANPADFELKSAHTEDINGKRVLVLEGRYTGNQQDSKHIFIDADGTGTAVQEIFFQAPKDKYQRYAKAADDAMHSTRWK
jgi:hypothetical protein